jgi:hypothetical protein
MEKSDALDLEEGVFKKSARALAESLKRSAERSRRRKTTPFRSAMSMLVFFQNRAGKNLSARQRGKLDRAKEELRALFGRATKGKRATPRRATKTSRGSRTSKRSTAKAKTSGSRRGRSS